MFLVQSHPFTEKELPYSTLSTYKSSKEINIRTAHDSQSTCRGKNPRHML